MLAEACKSVEKAIEKCPAGIYSEIKYDGERVQLHKKGNEFKCVFFCIYSSYAWVIYMYTQRGCVNEIVSITREFTLYSRRFFSRNLKPVLEHKTKRLEEFIPQVSVFCACLFC